MGLDNYWIHPETSEVMELPFQPPLKLVGGVFSEHGNGSFRGKVYNAFIVAVTGQSLYQDLIPNAVVREMATALESVSERDVEFFRGESWGPINCPNRERASYLSVEVLRDLKRMFLAYADAGAALESSW